MCIHTHGLCPYTSYRFKTVTVWLTSYDAFRGHALFSNWPCSKCKHEEAWSLFYVIASAKWLLKYNGPSSCRLKACIHCWYCWPQIIVITPWLQNSVSVRVSLKVHICRYTAKQTSHFSFHFQENQHVQSKICLHVTRGLSSSQSAKKMWITSNFVPSRSKIQSAEELNYRVYIKKTDIATVVSSLDLHFWGLKSSTLHSTLVFWSQRWPYFDERIECNVNS